MKLLCLILPLLSSLAIAQSLVEDECQCRQVKCPDTNTLAGCLCVNRAEKECREQCPSYVPTKMRKCSLPQQPATVPISTSTAATSTAALPLPTVPILGIPVPVLPVSVQPKPTLQALPLPDLPLVPGCECEETMCILSFPEGCHCQWGVKKDCYDKCGGKSPGINTCPALPAPVQPKPTPQVLPLPDLPLVPGCECEETMCILSFPEGCHCQWGVKKDCYDKCGGKSPGINTCPALPAPLQSTPPAQPTPPVRSTLIVQPTPQALPLPDLPLVPGCECEEMMCIQSFPDSCHCAWGIAKDCYDKCGGKSPGVNTCPPKNPVGGGSYDGPVKRAAAPEPQRSTVPIPVNTPNMVSGTFGAVGTKACNYEERFCAQEWPQSCICANANSYVRWKKCGGVKPFFQTCTSPLTSPTKPTTTTENPTPTPTGESNKVQSCGGNSAGQTPCPTGYKCVDDPYVDQPCGLACDRLGICVKEELCGGFAGFRCPDARQVCLDNPNDDCDPENGGADCGGLCFWPPALRQT